MITFKREPWIHQILETQDQEISCSACLDLVDQYVEVELEGAPLAPKHIGVKQHVRQCRVCREEYSVLRELALLKERGGWHSGDELENII